MKRRKRSLISVVSFLSATALLILYQWNRHALLSQLANVPSSSYAVNSPPMDRDADCVFRPSPLYRSIFVYPSPRDPLFESMRSKRARVDKDGKVPMWRWLETNDEFCESNLLIYDIDHDSENQFTTDVYVHDIVTHPKSYLQTNDPEKAKLFYIPHMETLHWRGLELLDQLPDDWKKKRITPYGEALLNAMDGNYTLWEERYGLTSKYWKRKQGADHFSVMSEPCNGLIHLQGWQRESENCVVTQRQHTPPIVISIELSTTYVGT